MKRELSDSDLLKYISEHIAIVEGTDGKKTLEFDFVLLRDSLLDVLEARVTATGKYVSAPCATSVKQLLGRAYRAYEAENVGFPNE